MSVLKIGVLSFFAVAALVAIVGYLLHRRSTLPSHLRPFFKNQAELDSSVESFKDAQTKRRRELKEPTNVAEAAEYLSLNDHNVVDSTFEQALQIVEANLKDDPSDYGQLLGEIYAFSNVHANREKAYYYYYIGLSQDGYSVGFRDENHDPPHYCGPVGDFRNESQVSGLVDELGFDRIKRIDLRAREWLKLNNFEANDFLEEEEQASNGT